MTLQIRFVLGASGRIEKPQNPKEIQLEIIVMSQNETGYRARKEEHSFCTCVEYYLRLYLNVCLFSLFPNSS